MKFILQGLVKTSCEHVFCAKCLKQQFSTQASDITTCPCCRTEINVLSIQLIDLKFRNQILDLEIECKTCHFQGPLEKIHNHKCILESNLLCHEVSTAATLRQILSIRPITTVRPKLNILHNLETEEQTKENRTKEANQQQQQQHQEPNEAHIPIPAPAVQQINPLQLNENTLDAILEKPINEPLTHIEEKLFTSTLKRKMFSSKERVIKAKTGGQPIHVTTVTKARTPSSTAKSPLKRKRARAIKKVRKVVSGPEATSMLSQQSTELKSTPKQKRVEICQKAGIRQGAKISKRMGLAIKSSVGLTWYQKRNLKRILKNIGVVEESDQAQRSEKKNLIGDIYSAENKNFEFLNDTAPDSVAGVHVHPAPYIYVNDLIAVIKDYLDKYLEASLLTWRGGKIPEDEIWIKIGGDKGGGSFKMCFQVGNLQHPNSVQNTVVFCYFLAPDSASNLSVALSRYAEQIKQLQCSTWRGKKIRVFLFGDYDFLAKLKGIAGASGKHPCLLCQIDRNQMQKSKTNRPVPKQRSARQMKRNYNAFIRKGKGNLKVQSKYYNVTRLPILPLPINQICLPYLHILLGVIKKHHDLLEAECHCLDLEIANEKAKLEGHLSEQLFDTYVKKLRKANKIEVQIQNLKSRVDDIDVDNCSLSVLNQTTEKKEKKKRKIERKIQRLREKFSEMHAEAQLEKGSGPLAQNLDTVLQSHGIQRQAYHGKSFVGNHCNKYLEVGTYTSVCQSVVDKTRELTKNNTLIAKAFGIKCKFQELFTRFRYIHLKISHDRFIVIDVSIFRLISRYLSYFRKKFPKIRIILKQHLLEDHVKQWLSEWHFGFGFFGEQGGESIHKEFNKLSRSHSGIRNSLKRESSIFEEHLLKNSPEVQVEIPPVTANTIVT